MTSRSPSCSTRRTPARTGSTSPITPGPSVSGTASLTAEGNNASATGRSTRPATSRAASPRDDAQPGRGGRRDRVRLASTNGRAVGDELVIDTGANVETVKIATILDARSGLAEPERDAASPLTKAHAANAAIQAFPQFRSINVPIDTRPPTATLPGLGGQQPRRPRRSRRSRPRAPTRRPARAATAVRDTWLDGTWVYPLPLDAVAALARQAHLDARPDRRRRQRQQGHVHVPGHDVVRRHRRAAGALRHRGHDPGRRRSPRCARRWPRPRRPTDGGNPAAAVSRPRRVRLPGPQRRRQREGAATCSPPTPRTSPPGPRHPGRRRLRPTSASRPSATRASRATRT